MGQDGYPHFTYFMSNRKKPGLSKQQIDVLLKIYAVNTKPSTIQRMDIARKLNAPEDKVKNWFQNKRAKDKKMREELSDENNPWDDLPEVYPSCNDLYKKRS